MKPTVIANSGTNENPQNHPSGSNINPAGNNIGPNTESGGTSNANAHPNLRQFPQFQTGFRFDDDDDIFLDAGLRSRLNRFRDPFSFARKRCGNNESNDDPYSRYFDDDTDFFQNFGSFPSRRRAAAPSGNNSNSNQFFEHIPQEFRHYIPESFGFQHDRTTPKHPQTKHDQQHPQQQQQHPYPQQQQHPHPQQQQQHPHPQQQQQHPQQYYETHAQPSSPTYTQPPQQKPKLCDAAIQTEDLGIPQNEIKEGKNLKQYGMRNTVDLGQKSPPEECRGSRSHSAPPVDGPEQGAFTSANAYEQASAVPPTRQVDESQQTSQGTQPMTPPYPPPRQYVPNSQQQYQPWNQQQQQQPPQQQEANSQSGGGFVRTVPIIIEGRSEPMVNKTRAPAQQQQPHQQQPQQQQPKQKPAHPTPLNTHQTPPPCNEAPPPQTPHTAECINRIQGIQRDVLALMAKVEHFKGMRNDKEYMYLDEMLTRNLLKLDTIDTNGKDSIRLARREAIKCIQASINVLEAKSEENAKAAQQQTVMDSIEQKADESATENICNENAESENLNRPLENIAIPLPPPPEKKQDQSVGESKKQESTEKTTEEAAPVISQETKVPISEKLEDDSKTEEKEACSTDPNLNPSSETVIESTAKESDDKESSNKSETLDSINPKISENVNEGEGIKATGGAVKKKIIKKKKPATKSESVSPAEKSSEDLSKEATEKGP